MSTLYRKYRPKKWSEIVDQNHVKITLQNELETGNIAHAYVFSGPRGLGKTTIARLLAKALNCSKRKKGASEPCNACPSCTAILSNASLDVLEIDAASHTGVDNVREHIIAASRVAPTSSPYKVFIIDEVHMLSLSAFNALLKTLEEPPAHVVLILATTEMHRLPDTIISRCQRFDFRKIPPDLMVERLRFLSHEEGIQVTDDVLQAIAHLSEGSLRDGESLLGQIIALGEKRVSMKEASLVLPRSDSGAVLDFLEYVFTRNIGQALLQFNTLVGEGLNIQLFVRDVLDVLRSLVFRSFGPELQEYTAWLNPESEKRIHEFRKRYTTEDFLKVLHAFFEATRIPTDALQLSFELAVVSLVGDKHHEQKDGLVASAKPTSIKKEVSAHTSTSSGTFDLGTIRMRWDAVLDSVRVNNRSLAVLWEVAELLAYAEGVLHVGFAYAFHLERIREQKNLHSIHAVLQEIFQTAIKVESRLIEASEQGAQQKTQAPDQTLQDVLKTFGGRVVQT